MHRCISQGTHCRVHTHHSISHGTHCRVHTYRSILHGTHCTVHSISHGTHREVHTHCSISHGTHYRVHTYHSLSHGPHSRVHTPQFTRRCVRASEYASDTSVGALHQVALCTPVPSAGLCAARYKKALGSSRGCILFTCCKFSGKRLVRVVGITASTSSDSTCMSVSVWSPLTFHMSSETSCRHTHFTWLGWSSVVSIWAPCTILDLNTLEVWTRKI